MSQEEKEKTIRLQSYKKFIAARVRLPANEIKDIVVRDGYDIFLSVSGDYMDANYAVKLKLNEKNSFQNKIKEILKDDSKDGFWKKLLGKKPDSDTPVTLFFLQNSDYKIIVPWGYRKGEGNEKRENNCHYKIHGTITFSIKVDDDTYNKLLARPLWETVTEDGVRYEYLSDYFIDGNGKQNGLSIWLRDQALPKIKEAIDGVENVKKDNIDNKLTNLKNEIKIVDGIVVGEIKCE